MIGVFIYGKINIIYHKNMAEKIIIITDDLLDESDLLAMATISQSEVNNIAKELEKELPKELKGITNARVQQTIREVQE